MSSSESNSSPLFGGSDYDEDEAMMTAMRESLREVEREGQVEEGVGWYRERRCGVVEGSREVWAGW